MRKPSTQKRCARIATWDLAKNICKLKNSDGTTLYTPIEARVMPAPTSTRPEESEFSVDSGASMHMLSKKKIKLRRNEHSKKVQNPSVVLTANREVHIHEEAQVFVHDLNQFVTVQLLEETSAVPSLGKLCEDQGYSYEWVSGQKPRLTKQGKKILCKTEDFMPLLVLGLSSESRASSSSTSLPQDSSSTPPSPATERSDDLAPGNWRDSPKNRNKFLQRDNNRASGDRLRDLPYWSQGFKVNLEETELPAPAHISHDSDSERPTKVAPKKHHLFTHFPKDGNCEVWLRTKITSALC